MTTLDIRTIPSQNHDKIIDEIEHIFARLKKEDEHFQADYEIIEDRPPTETDPNDPVVSAVYDAVAEVLETEPQYNGVPGATDGTFLHVHGIPIVTIGTGDRDFPHLIDNDHDYKDSGENIVNYRSAVV